MYSGGAIYTYIPPPPPGNMALFYRRKYSEIGSEIRYLGCMKSWNTHRGFITQHPSLYYIYHQSRDTDHPGLDLFIGLASISSIAQMQLSNAMCIAFNTLASMTV